MQIGPQRPAVDVLNGMQHVMMIVPVDAHVDEADHVAQEYRDERHERRQVGAMRRLQLQHHDGDDDRDHAIAECFESPFTHPCSPRSPSRLLRADILRSTDVVRCASTNALRWDYCVVAGSPTGERPPRAGRRTWPIQMTAPNV